MLEYEWRELEALCERLADLRHRQTFALRSKNVGLTEGLKLDIERVARQREQLVQHISARLGSASAAETGGVEDHARSPAGASRGGGGSGGGGAESPEESIGFSEVSAARR